MSYRDALEHGQSNVGLGMVPCRPNCRCSECTIERLRARVAELEAQLQEWRNGFQGACYACEPVGEMNIALRARIAELEAERGRLHNTLTRCVLHDPPGDCFAEEVVQLRAENDRLREALRVIVHHQNAVGGSLSAYSRTVEIARAALEGKG